VGTDRLRHPAAREVASHLAHNHQSQGVLLETPPDVEAERSYLPWVLPGAFFPLMTLDEALLNCDNRQGRHPYLKSSV
jgi:hypothetical protein